MPRDHRLYLDDIVGAIDRIQSYVEGMDYSRFAADQRTMDAVVRNLEIIGEAARSLPGEIKDAMLATDWRKVVGLRNLLLHEYFAVSTRVVWDIVQTKLDHLRVACRNALTDGLGERGAMPPTDSPA
jgi:uncharacterized protein with HEPN domain